MYENMNTFRPFFFFGIVKIDHRHTHTIEKKPNLYNQHYQSYIFLGLNKQNHIILHME